MRPFDTLGERLLHAGIAPHHVRRYLRELSDHLDDIVRQDGIDTVEARARLGSDEALAAPMLANPELRSFAARYPWAVFGLGPMMMVPLTLAITAFGELLFLLAVGFWFKAQGIDHPIKPAWLTLTVALWDGFASYIAPLAIAALIGFIGVRQRIPNGWIVVGVAIVCVLGGCNAIQGNWSITPGRVGVTVWWFIGLTPPFSWTMLFSSLVHAALNLAVSGGALLIWLRPLRQSAISA